VTFVADTIHRQPDVLVYLGQNLTLPCRTSPGKSAIWWYQGHERASVNDMYNVRGDLMNGYKRRPEKYPLTRDAGGDYTMGIVNISHSDAGLYTCVIDDGYGDYFITRVNVSGILEQWSIIIIIILLHENNNNMK